MSRETPINVYLSKSMPIYGPCFSTPGIWYLFVRTALLSPFTEDFEILRLIDPTGAALEKGNVYFTIPILNKTFVVAKRYAVRCYLIVPFWLHAHKDLDTLLMNDWIFGFGIGRDNERATQDLELWNNVKRQQKLEIKRYDAVRAIWRVCPTKSLAAFYQLWKVEWRVEEYKRQRSDPLCNGYIRPDLVTGSPCSPVSFYQDCFLYATKLCWSK